MQRKPRIGLNADYRPTKQDSPAFIEGLTAPQTSQAGMRLLVA